MNGGSVQGERMIPAMEHRFDEILCPDETSGRDRAPGLAYRTSEASRAIRA